MDPDFQRALVRVAVTGGIIGAIGVILLIFAVRGFRGEKMTSFAGPLLMVLAIAFVMLCCFLLLRVSSQH